MLYTKMTLKRISKIVCLKRNQRNFGPRPKFVTRCKHVVSENPHSKLIISTCTSIVRAEIDFNGQVMDNFKWVWFYDTFIIFTSRTRSNHQYHSGMSNCNRIEVDCQKLSWLIDENRGIIDAINSVCMLHIIIWHRSKKNMTEITWKLLVSDGCEMGCVDHQLKINKNMKIFIKMLII